MQVDDRVAAQRGGVGVGHPAAQAGQALDGDAVGVGLGGGERAGDRVRLVDLVAPVDPDRPAALGLDGWSRNPAVVRVGAENSSTLCDLGIFVNQPAQSIDPHDPHVRRRSERRDGSKR